MDELIEILNIIGEIKVQVNDNRILGAIYERGVNDYE